jgi:hypothetical protein
MCQHASVRRATALWLLAGTFALAGCGATADGTSPPVTQAAGAQTAALHWVEKAGSQQSGLVFRVRSFSVTPNGWRAAISMTNQTGATFTIDGYRDPLENAFGLMLFRTGSHAELEQRNAGLTLPVLRQAMTFAPPLPTTLRPDATWSGTVSAPGALPSGLWVRLVFGAFVPKPAMPDSLRRQGAGNDLVWITDHAYRLLG